MNLVQEKSWHFLTNLIIWWFLSIWFTASIRITPPSKLLRRHLFIPWRAIGLFIQVYLLKLSALINFFFSQLLPIVLGAKTSAVFGQRSVVNSLLICTITLYDLGWLAQRWHSPSIKWLRCIEQLVVVTHFVSGFIRLHVARSWWNNRNRSRFCFCFCFFSRGAHWLLNSITTLAQLLPKGQKVLFVAT